MSSPPFAGYLALPPLERRVFALLSVVHVPLHRTAMADWLKRAEIRNEKNQLFSTMALSALLARWSAAGLVAPDARDEGAFRVGAELKHALFAHLQAQDELAQLARFVREQAPIFGRYSYMPDSRHVARELALALYLGPNAELERALQQLRPHSGAPRGEPFLEAFGLSAPSAGLKRLGLEHAEIYLQRAFEFAADELTPVDPELLAFVREAGPLLESRVVARVALYLTLRDEQEAALRSLHGRDDAESASARCIIALTREEFAEARMQAERALEHTLTKKSKRLKGLSGALWPWGVLALLTEGANPRALELAREQLALGLHREPERVVITSALLRLEQQLALRATQRGMEHERLESAESWSELLFWALVLRFMGAPVPATRARALALQRERAVQGEFAWVARELANVVERAQSVGLARLYAPEEPWQRSLRALDHAIELAGGAAMPERAPAERLVWTLIAERDGSHQLTARVQVRKANGFSAGRQISWKRLYEAPADARWLDAADRRVIPYVRAVRDYGYRGSETYLLDSVAPLALVGHPRVFADHECRTPLEIVRGEVRIETQERGDEIVIALTPAACLELPAVCERDGVGRMQVYALSEAQQLVARQLPRLGLAVPSQARAGVQRVLGKLVQHFAVATELELEGAEVEEVDVDARLHIQLRRSAAGLSVRPCVAPLGAAPVFSPGVGPARAIGSRAGAGAGAGAVRGTRDLEDERRRFDQLLAACPILRESETDGRDYRVVELTSCLELLCELRGLGDDVVLEWPEGQPLAVIGERGFRDLRLRVWEDEGAWLSADGELEVDAELKLGLRELLARQAGRHGRFLALDDGRFFALSEELKRALDAAGALSRVRGERIEFHPLALFGVANLAQARLEHDDPVAERLRRAREAAQLEPEVPATLEATLRPYQRAGYAWLSRLAHWGAGACLADDMGLGKTLQALALLVEHAPKGPSLVVAPTSVCANWLDEARRYAPSLRVARLSSGDRERQLAKLGAFDVLICSYGVLQQEASLLATKRFQVVVLDEAQAIKNAATLRARAALGLVGEARIALTGTPVENHLGELWSIMGFLNPGLLGSAKAFEERFLKPIQRQSDRDAAQLLKRIVQPFMLRRKKSEVLDDLPEKTVITLRVEPSAEERALFAALREQALARVSRGDNPAQTRMHLLAELTRLRRAACHPDLVAAEAGLASSKLSTLETLLAELREGGHRALVFSQFVDYLTIVRKRLDAIGVSYQYLDGSTSTEARASAVNAFQAGRSDVFLISLKAGGFGLNLTAADYVVHLDPWWNPAVEDQASDRVHRIGQTRPVTIYRLVMEGSIEEKILALHANKRELADDLLAGTGTTRTFDVDELVGLIEQANVEPADVRAGRALELSADL